MKKDILDKDIELQNEEFQEILGKMPGWIQRRGIFIIVCFISVILIGSALFKYPDVITTEMTLTAANPPVALVANTSGKLREFYVKDKQLVQSSMYLAVLENPARTEDVIRLKSYLQSFSLQINSVPQLLPKDLHLGTMQTLHSNFYSTLFEYREFLQLQYYTQKIDFMKNRTGAYQRYAEMVESQKPIVETQEKLRYNQYLRDSILNAKGLISNENLEGTRDQYLQSSLSVKNLNTTIQNARVQVTEMKESILDIENQYREKRNELENGLKTIVAQLLTEIQAWELTYVLKSPIDGEVTFINYWAGNQNVNAGETVFSVIPKSNKKILGKAKMPITRSGKVKIGQTVNIRFESFTDTEYGVVRGRVKMISAVPSSDAKIGKYYTVDIELPNGLYTSYKKKLPYLPDMLAQADIVTENISLLERFFLPIKKIWIEGMK